MVQVDRSGDLRDVLGIPAETSESTSASDGNAGVYSEVGAIVRPADLACCFLCCCQGHVDFTETPPWNVKKKKRCCAFVVIFAKYGFIQEVSVLTCV